MACNIRRRMTPFVGDVVSEMQRDKIHTKHRACDCHKCSKGKIKTIVVGADVFRTTDPRVKYVATHSIECPRHKKPHLFFKMHESCYNGDASREPQVGRCSTCKFAESIQIKDEVPSIYKVGNPVEIHRTLYKCTNRKRSEQLNKDDVYMCGYVTCEFYKEK